jgi:hypothetical protein
VVVENRPADAKVCPNYDLAASGHGDELCVNELSTTLARARLLQTDSRPPAPTLITPLVLQRILCKSRRLCRTRCLADVISTPVCFESGVRPLVIFLLYLEPTSTRPGWGLNTNFTTQALCETPKDGPRGVHHGVL